MAYGDATENGPAVPWSEFEHMEYLWRLEELIRERDRAFSFSCTPLEGAEEADIEWRRLDREIEETALELAAYAFRHRLKTPDNPTPIGLGDEMVRLDRPSGRPCGYITSAREDAPQHL